MAKRGTVVSYGSQSDADAAMWLEKFDNIPSEPIRTEPPAKPVSNYVPTLTHSRERWIKPTEEIPDLKFVEEPSIVPEVVKIVSKSPTHRRADPRDRDKFLPVRGKNETQKQVRFAETPPVTHISSDDRLNKIKNENRVWDTQLKQGCFAGARAISSDELVEPVPSASEVFVKTLEIASSTVQDAVVNLFSVDDWKA